MKCFVACLIWVSGYGHYDKCNKEVTLRYQTNEFYYVSVNDPKIEVYEDVRIEIIKNGQQVDKMLCSKPKEIK